MKKVLSLLLVFLATFSTTFAWDLFENDQLRTDEDYRQTIRPSYERIRAKDWKTYYFENTGRNSLYRSNIFREVEDQGRVVFGRDCLFWSACRAAAYKQTNGFNRSYMKKRITGNEKPKQYDQAVLIRRATPLDSELDGSAKVLRLRNVRSGNRR